MNKATAGIIVIAGAAVGIIMWMLCIRGFLKMRTLASHISKGGSFTGIGKAAAARTLLQHAVTWSHVTDRSEDGFTLQLLLSTLSVKLESQAEGTRFRVDVDMSRLSRLFNRIMAVFVLVWGPLFVLGIPCLLWFLAVQNEHPAIRWQVVQVVQIIHVLWPPFLVYFLYKLMRGRVEAAADNIQALIGIADVRRQKEEL